MLYRNGGFYEPADLQHAIERTSARCDFIADVSAFCSAFEYVRPLPRHIVSPDPAFIKELDVYFKAINATSHQGPSSRIVQLTDVYAYGNRIHHIRDEVVLTVYETARAVDRPYTTQPEWTAAELRAATLHVPNDRPSLYMGTAGFVNYGHWLIDDLAKIEASDAVAKFAGADSVNVILPGADHTLNAIKEQSLRCMQPTIQTRHIICVPHDRIVHYDVLYYVTPISYHPVLKSPEACRLLREQAVRHATGTAAAGTGRRIFVARRGERGRTMLNQPAIEQIFRMHGFSVIDVEQMSFAEQVLAFHGADVVAGSMGAAMTNTVFCRPGARLLYLAPQGWLEPFYWDLAAVGGHAYSAIFGATADAPAEVHKASFSVDEGELVRMLADICATA